MAVMTKSKVERALDVLVEEIPALLAEEGVGPDVCILATRVACFALAEVGIKASPLPVRFDGFSPAYVRAVADGTLDFEVPPTREHLEALVADGAWQVTIGHPEAEGTLRPNGRPGFNAHLLALVERKWALDLTIAQASRPAKDMRFEPHYFPATREFMAGETVLLSATVDGESSHALYKRIDKNTYLVAPDWTKVRRSDPLVRKAAAALRRAVG